MESIIKTALFLVASLTISTAKPTEELSMPLACAGRDYCTVKHPKYPSAEVEALLQTADLSFYKAHPRLVQRVDDGSEDRDCEVDPAVSSDDLIYEIVDADDNVRVVLQSETGFRQKVSIERCLNPGRIQSETVHFKEEVISNYNLQCVDETLAYRFLVLTLDGTSVEMIQPRTDIPVACNCKLLSEI